MFFWSLLSILPILPSTVAQETAPTPNNTVTVLSNKTFDVPEPVSVSLIFPRANETYARQYGLPVVFSLTNLEALWPYKVGLAWKIRAQDGSILEHYGAGSSLDFNTTGHPDIPFSQENLEQSRQSPRQYPLLAGENEQFIETSFHNEVANLTDNPVLLTWELYIGSCYDVFPVMNGSIEFSMTNDSSRAPFPGSLSLSQGCAEPVAKFSIVGESSRGVGADPANNPWKCPVVEKVNEDLPRCAAGINETMAAAVKKDFIERACVDARHWPLQDNVTWPHETAFTKETFCTFKNMTGQEDEKSGAGKMLGNLGLWGFGLAAMHVALFLQ